MKYTSSEYFEALEDINDYMTIDEVIRFGLQQPTLLKLKHSLVKKESEKSNEEMSNYDLQNKT